MSVVAMGENDSQMILMFGEMRGQMRELVHTLNNLVAKFESLAKEVGDGSHIPADVADLKLRVAALEAAENRRSGALNLSSFLFKAVPWASLGGGAVLMLKLLGVFQ